MIASYGGLAADLKCREAYPFWVVRVTQGVRTGRGLVLE